MNSTRSKQLVSIFTNLKENPPLTLASPLPLSIHGWRGVWGEANILFFCKLAEVSSLLLRLFQTFYLLVRGLLKTFTLTKSTRVKKPCAAERHQGVSMINGYCAHLDPHKNSITNPITIHKKKT